MCTCAFSPDYRFCSCNCLIGFVFHCPHQYQIRGVGEYPFTVRSYRMKGRDHSLLSTDSTVARFEIEPAAGDERAVG